MIWGCQWDQAVRKCLEKDKLYLSTNSKKYGNYTDSTGFTYTKIDGTTGTKTSTGKIGAIVSGCLTPIYNIYDMGGNVWEWTQETFNNNIRVLRGGYYSCTSTSDSAAKRNEYCTPNTGTNGNCGSRVQLYIK